MLLQLDKTYVLIFNAEGHHLTYTATILELDNNFVKFKDKYGDIITYKLSMLNSAKEIEND